MSGMSGEPFPNDPVDSPGVPALDPSLNPFVGNQPVDQQPSRLGLGGYGILGHAGVFVPPAPSETPQDAETVTDIMEAARKACGLIGNMYISGTNPQDIIFPACDDMAVIGESLKRLADTPLGLGYGPFPPAVHIAMSRFVRETTDHYRRSRNLEASDLVPLKIELPEWLKNNPSFDILSGSSLMDIEVVGKVNSTLAVEARHCRIKFLDDVLQNANIGMNANRCTFIFEGNMNAGQSFSNAKNISVDIEGDHSGDMGTVSTSKITCQGRWSGYVKYNGPGCYFINVDQRSVS